MALLTLPNEILLQIWDELGIESDFPYADQASLLRVCRQSYNLFMPVLYKKFKVGMRGLATIQSFTQLILRNQDIASSVQKVSVECWGFGKTSTEILGMNPVLIRERLGTLCLPPNEELPWMVALFLGQDDAWLAILLLHLPNLRSLRMKTCHLPDDTCTYSDRAAQGIAAQRIPLNSLQHLTNLDINLAHNPHLPWFLSNAFPWVRLPSMRRLRVTSAMDSYDERDLVIPPIGPSGVTHIKIDSSNCINTLASLITSCETLKSFKYDHQDGLVRHPVIYTTSDREWTSTEVHNYKLWRRRQGILDPSLFYSALFNRRSTLQTLWITLASDSWRYPSLHSTRECPAQILGSLREFKALTQLRIRLQNLLEFPDGDVGRTPVTSLLDTLPDSIEYVFIQECARPSLPMLIDELQPLAAAGNSHLPHLRQLVIQQPSHEQDRLTYSHPTGQLYDPREVMEAMDGNRKAEVDIELHVYRGLMYLRKALEDMGVDFVVLDKSDWRLKFLDTWPDRGVYW
ncbi:hypothetical protein BO70DRAFT_417662 [Aspergillus heteromorphus CBS 117.55]|uniref:F-box domain-containing protein n=1 Tax=Aspergillus heteromorphus CBS 117.55 TaxID=1448321 RepID=A0A317V0S8_9EURO|nr:uncharacterized protein BO70DRAFT_417662 [Aspergillus heteromorphus CBS 117.55]PWY67934.1 hypothetical protein BO70DRAFT_417662 [Aspergillus heteromorphus CBS 117.55]